jgi:NAD(P)-dependent dehydrogenase (short-subunit alcohol dehydrogenase family)
MTDATTFTNKLHGQRVLVIGGTSGIGFGVAQATLELGATVIVASSNPTRVSEAVTRLQTLYPSAKARVSGIPLDLGNIQTVDANVKAVFDTLTEGDKVLNHVVFTAGDAPPGVQLDTLTAEGLLQAGTVRYFGAIFVVKHAKRVLPKSPASSITLTTGSISQKPAPGFGVGNGYATAVHGLTRGFALDLAPVRVNAISPGAVDTELLRKFPAHLVKLFTDKMTTGQIGTVEDVAEAYLYVIKDKNVTGTLISTNGGGLLV